MRQGPRLIVAVLAFVLGLHVFMLAGLGDHDAAMPEHAGEMQMAAVAPSGLLAGPTEVWDGGSAQPAGPGHDMAVACLAVLVGVVLLGAGLGRIGRRWTQQRRWPVRPATPPPSPPPIALGISRT